MNSNIYYQPTKFNLKMVGDIQWGEAWYNFDITAVWYHEDAGKFYVGSDSGCSCPSPFEDIISVDELSGPMDAWGVLEALKARMEEVHLNEREKAEAVSDIDRLFRLVRKY